ncbi:MAG: hypothetical protein ACLQQ0_03650 [Limisphaerales bacterium]
MLQSLYFHRRQKSSFAAGKVMAQFPSQTQTKNDKINPQPKKNMIRTTTIQRWLPSLMTAAALAGSVGLCQAQSWDFSTGLQGWFNNNGAPLTSMVADPTGGPSGGPSMDITFDGVTTTECDPAVALSPPENTAYLQQVDVDFYIDPGSGVDALGAYGQIQCVFRQGGSWNSIWDGGNPQFDSGWQHITFIISGNYCDADTLQFQFQETTAGGYNNPVSVRFANIVVSPISNPWIYQAFNDATANSSMDAPYYNAVTHAGPTYITPPGSITYTWTGAGYSWNQFGGVGNFDATRYQYMGFDVYIDPSSTGPAYGGVQPFIFDSGWGAHWVAAVPFDASMVGKWTHFDVPSAASGVTSSPQIAMQSYPGNDGGANTVTLYIDNIQFWNPEVIPTLSILPGTPAGVQMTVDNDGTANQYDQEGITTPAIDNTSTNFFWVGQYPAIYSFSLTNWPAPATAPGFDAHMYLVNGDSIIAGPNDWSYNQGYSGIPYNAFDYAGFRIANSPGNNYLQATFEWKTDLGSANPPPANVTTVQLSQYASANGTWTVTINDDNSATLTGPDNNPAATFTLPGATYDANFSPVASCVQFGVAKNDTANTGVNNGKSAIFNHVHLENSVNGVMFDDSFAGPGLTGEYAWQVATYYIDGANRCIWQPAGTAFWVQYNTAGSGWNVQSASDLDPTWGDAGVTYSYVDLTGTNRLAAVPTTALPVGNTGFFRVMHP